MNPILEFLIKFIFDVIFFFCIFVLIVVSSKCIIQQYLAMRVTLLSYERQNRVSEENKTTEPETKLQ